MKITESIKSLVRDVPDFPRPGILFKDITPVLANPAIRDEVVHVIAARFADQRLTAVAGIEARGFILGSLIAHELKLPFVPIRKSGKLPYKSIREEYLLEYGAAAIEVHEDSLNGADRVLIHDDLLATGGTAAAAGKLVQRLGAELVGFSFLINLSFLPGEGILRDTFGITPFSVATY
jgi:adenine phosphoribosyltransferase